MMTEEWKPLVGREEMYEVSNLGNFKSKTHIARGMGYTVTGKPLKTTAAKNGYSVINIGRKTEYAHRLVARTFIGEIPAGMDINHKNGDKQDNRVANLEIVTRAENILHAYRVLRRKPSPMPDTRKAVAQMCGGKIIAVFPSAREACKQTGISYKGISQSCHGGYNAGGYKWQFATPDLLQAAINADTGKATS